MRTYDRKVIGAMGVLVADMIASGRPTLGVSRSTAERTADRTAQAQPEVAPPTSASGCINESGIGTIEYRMDRL